MDNRPQFAGLRERLPRFFRAASARELEGLPSNCGLKIAYESIDRHAGDGAGHRLALRWFGKQGELWIRTATCEIKGCRFRRFLNFAIGLHTELEIEIPDK